MLDRKVRRLTLRWSVQTGEFLKNSNILVKLKPYSSVWIEPIVHWSTESQTMLKNTVHLKNCRIFIVLNATLCSVPYSMYTLHNTIVYNDCVLTLIGQVTHCPPPPRVVWCMLDIKRALGGRPEKSRGPFTVYNALGSSP